MNSPNLFSKHLLTNFKNNLCRNVLFNGRSPDEDVGAVLRKRESCLKSIKGMFSLEVRRHNAISFIAVSYREC